jgi:hypothetical protein
MSQRDLIINGVLLLAILAVAALLVTFRPTKLQPPGRLLVAQETSGPIRTETGPPLPGIAPLERYNTIQQANILRTIITPTPTPAPTPTPRPTPPPIAAMMSQYALLMMDPPKSVTLQNKQNAAELLEWKVGEKRTVKFQNLELQVTLKSVDANEFKATFTAPEKQTHVYSYFGGTP